MSEHTNDAPAPTESKPAAAALPDVPGQVFNSFLETLKESGLPEELIARLRKILVTERTLTDRALKAAVLGEEPTQ